jgi:predicted transcriptional regulator
MSTRFDDFLEEQLKDDEFRKEFEALQPEHAVIQAIIDARKESGLTQKELAEKTGIAQGDISKIEKGLANPSLKTLKRLALGMGKVLKIEFVSIENTIKG